MKPLGSWDWVGAKRGDSGTLGQSRPNRTQVPSSSLPIGLESGNTRPLRSESPSSKQQQRRGQTTALPGAFARRSAVAALPWRTLGNPEKTHHQPNQCTPLTYLSGPAGVVDAALHYARTYVCKGPAETLCWPLPLLLHLTLISGVICSFGPFHGCLSPQTRQRADPCFRALVPSVSSTYL